MHPMGDLDTVERESERRYALWGGRFRGGLSEEAAALNQSLPVDGRLFGQEIEVSSAWAEALATAGALTRAESERIVHGLGRVGERIAAGAAEGAEDEDIHTLVERLLGEEIGELAGKLRTGRSRNDQVATISRLWCLEAVDVLDADIVALQRALLGKAEETIEVIVPCYTHLQRAQPIRMSHFFLSHF